MTDGRESAARWVVSGRVQGVGFRWFVVRKAGECAVTGWVRNLPNGSVEVAARGTEATLHTLEQALRSGPAAANVESVEKSDIPPEQVSSKSFEIK